jgi:nickel transport protein
MKELREFVMGRRTVGHIQVRYALQIAVVAMFFWIGTGSAAAHRVIVFAWVEGDTVHVESKFPGGKKVHHGQVLVYDAEGELVIEGETDEEGAFDFQVPGKSSLRIVLDAGMGHRAEWVIPAKEVQGVVPEKAEDPVEPQESAAQEGGAFTSPASAVTLREIEAVVEETVEKKLQPVLRMLAESRQQGPSFSEILGGIGYIVGLVGLAAYLHYRRKCREMGADSHRQELK